MKRHHVWCGFVVLFILLATTQTQAGIQPNPNIGQNKGSKGIVFVNRDQFRQLANTGGVKVLTFKISKDELKKLAASGPKGCGCALQDVEFGGPGGWACMAPCLEKLGVIPSTVAACAGSCIAAGGGNYVALYVCAVCTGVAAADVLYCSLKCSGLFSQNIAPKTRLTPNLRHGQKRSGDSVKVRLNTTASRSLR